MHPFIHPSIPQKPTQHSVTHSSIHSSTHLSWDIVFQSVASPQARRRGFGPYSYFHPRPQSPSSPVSKCFPLSPFLICRHSAGERSLAEEAPPVVSAAHPPGRLLLLAGRHASSAGTVGPLPQRGHQKELHSVNLGAFHGRARGQHDPE